MKRLIYQVYIGHKSKLYDFCTASVQNYAKRYGIDYICQTEPILKIVPDMSRTGRSKLAVERLGYLPIFEKENAFSYLDKYDQIAIIDSDIYIRKSATNIFDEFQGEFGAVVERDMPITESYKHKIRTYSREQYAHLTKVDFSPNECGYEFMNMGMMIFSDSILKYLKGQSPEQFIHRQEFKDFVDGIGFHKWSTDQTLLNYWIRSEKMNIQRMHWKWNTLYGAVNAPSLKDSQFIHFFLRDHLPLKGENVEELLTKQGLL